MNKRCGIKKNKTTIRWLVVLLISIIMLTGIALPVKGVPVTEEKLENDVGYVDDIDRGSIDSNNIYNSQNTNDSNNENLEGESSNTIYSTEQSTESNIITTLSENVVTAENYYEVSMSMNNSSTNEHYLAKGIYIDSNGETNIIIALQKNSNFKSIDGVKIGDKEIQKPNFRDISDTTFILHLPNNIVTVENKFGFLIINIGKIEGITEIFNFAIDTPTGGSYGAGWDLVGATIKINIKYEISKTVNKSSATIGDEVQYTVTIKNSSDIPLYGVNVIDAIPVGLTIKSVNGSTNYSINNNILTLDNNITLAKDQTKTYTIIAIVSEDAVAGKRTNTATMGSNSIIPKSATADVTVNTKNVIIKKTITGNMGEVSKKFNFTATVDKGTVYNKTNTFDLAHNEQHTLSELPTDSVLILSETNADGYTVKVTINGIEQTAEEGKYKIELKNYDKAEIIVNNYKDVIIDTGFTLDSLPYLIILFVVIIGGSLFFINKRRQEN